MLILAGLTVVTMVGGALLMAKIFDVAQSNAAFICSFGAALNSTPVKQRADETDAEFRKRVRISRQFVRDLNEIQDCIPPAVIRVDPESKPALHTGSHNTPPHTGGDADSPPPSTGSEQPSPPPAGGGHGDNPSGPEPTPPPTSPPPDSGPVSDVLDQVCHLNPLGIRVCL
jgi:hypothetical protein